MTKQYTVTVNGTAYEVTVESVSGGRMASAPVARTASAPVARAGQMSRIQDVRTLAGFFGALGWTSSPNSIIFYAVI